MEADKQKKMTHLRSARDKLVQDRSKFDEEYGRRFEEAHQKCNTHKIALTQSHNQWETEINA